MRGRWLSLFCTLVILVAVAPLASLRADEFAHYEFRRTWERTDLPVQNGRAARTWMWGPGPMTPALWERYLEA
jgi:hypothetical protein